MVDVVGDGIGDKKEEESEVSPPRANTVNFDNVPDEETQNAIIAGARRASAPVDHGTFGEYWQSKRILRYCCSVTIVGGILYGWNVAKVFSRESEYYFGLFCGEDPDCKTVYREGQTYATFYYRKVGLECLGIILGALISGHFIFDKFGRKATMLIGGIVYLLAAIIQALSVNIYMMLAFIFMSYIGLGSLIMVCPVYISEIAPTYRRGQLTILWYIGFILGVIIVGFWNPITENSAYGWRISYVGDGLFSLIIILLSYSSILPESHIFLMLKNRKDEARNVLIKIRPDDFEMIESELNKIEKEIKFVKEKKPSCLTYRLLVGSAMQIIKELIGTKSMGIYMYYMLASVYGTDFARWAVVVINFFNLIVVFIALFTIEKIGRPMMFFSGGLVISVILLMSLWASAEIGTEGYRSTADAAFFVFVYLWYQLGFSYSWGPLPTLYCAEIFDIGNKGRSVGVTTTFLAIADIIVELYFLDHSVRFPQLYEYLTFISFSFIGCLLGYFIIPETSNKTDAEIRKEFQTHRPKLIRIDWGPD